MLKTPKKNSAFNHNQLDKCLTGIKGFDEITEGGLPKNRTTLFSGSTGTGKTLLGIDFLINGAVNYNERGVFMSFEETEGELYEDGFPQLEFTKACFTEKDSARPCSLGAQGYSRER